MKRIRLIGVIIAATLLVSLLGAVPAWGLPQNLGVDETRSAPLARRIETASEVQSLATNAVNVADIARATGAAVGTYAAKVTAGGGAEATLTLSSAPSFEVAGSATYAVWVKPGPGAKWIEFKLDGSTIKTAGVKDGRHLVGTHLTSGKWQKVELLLTEASPALTYAGALTAKTNGGGAVWYFDDVTGGDGVSHCADLSGYATADVTLTNGALRLDDGANHAVIGDGVRTETVFEWKAPETVNAPVALNITQLDTEMTKPTLPVYLSTAGDTLEFSFAGGPVGIYYLQFAGTLSNGGSFDLEYYDEAAGQWKTISLNTAVGSALNAGSNIAQQWRLRLVAGTLKVTTLQLYATNAFPVYKSPSDIPIPAGKLDGLKMHVSATNVPSGKPVCFARVSTDSGATWGDWLAPGDDGALEGLPLPPYVGDCLIQYRVATQNKDTKILSVRFDRPVPSGAANSLVLEEDAVLERAIVREGGEAPDAKWYALPNGVPGDGVLTGDGRYYSFTSLVSGSARILCAIDTTTGEMTHRISNVYYSPLCYDFSGDGRYFSYWDTNSTSQINTYDIYSNSSVSTNGVSTPGVMKSNNNGTVSFTISNIPYYTDLSGTLSGTIETSGCTWNIIGYRDNWLCYSSLSTTSPISQDQTIYLRNVMTKKLYSLKKPAVLDNAARRKSVDGFTFNPHKTTVYFQNLTWNNNVSTYGGFSSYNFLTTKEKTLPSHVFAINTVMDDGRLFVSSKRDRLVTQGFLDPETGSFTSLGDYTGGAITCTAIDVNGDGTDIQGDTYRVTPNYAYVIWNDDETQKIMPLPKAETETNPSANRVLLTFDGGLSYNTYKNGRWETVLKGKKPTDADLAAHGMTPAQVNALGKSDFAKLYAGGRRIHEVGFAMLLRRDGAGTPSLSGFEVVTSGGDPYVCAVKSRTLDATGWRRVTKLHALETGPRAFEACYFLHVGGTYYHRDPNGAMAGTPDYTIDALLGDPRANWEELSELGYDAAGLGALSSADLTTALAGQTAQVVYVVRVKGASTAGYSSAITADYGERRFQTAYVTLEVQMTGGNTLTFASIERDSAEDFMDWLQRRQYGYGPVFFVFEGYGAGSQRYYQYFNYYAVQGARIVEQ